jgi:hypothetical protein
VAVDRRNLNAKAYIPEITAKVENDWQENAMKLAFQGDEEG